MGADPGDGPPGVAGCPAVLPILVHSAHAAPPADKPGDARPAVVVAVGDGLVVAPGGGDAVSAGLAAGLGDCLEERAPKRFGVVDRSAPGETLASVRPKLAEVADLAPAWVVVTLGARELADPATEPQKLAAELGALASELRGDGPRKVIVLGAVPAGGDGERAALEARVAGFNGGLTGLSLPGVVPLDPGRIKKLPKDGLVDGSKLSAAGQAKVVAAICELVLSAP